MKMVCGEIVLPVYSPGVVSDALRLHKQNIFTIHIVGLGNSLQNDIVTPEEDDAFRELCATWACHDKSKDSCDNNAFHEV